MAMQPVEELVEEADGGFFESFTALSWKQENRRRQSAREDENEGEPPPPPPTFPSAVSSDGPLTNEQKEALYTHLVYVIEHRVPDGDAPEDERRQLMALVQRVLAIHDDVHQRCLDAARRLPAPSLYLDVTVVEARGLEAKDPNGFSDPYCMLGIQPGGCAVDAPAVEVPEEEDAKTVKRGHGFRLSFKKREREPESVTPTPAPASNAIPAKLVCATSVQPATLNPVWNDTFRFDVDDVATDKLHLDIWDHDDESSVLEAVKKLNEIQTWKGLGRYFKQIAQSARTSGGDNVDDFLGSVTIALHSIPASGLDHWFELRGRSLRSSVQGSLRLHLTWAGHLPPGITINNQQPCAFIAHEQLLWAIVQYEVAQCVEGETFQWDGNFPGHAASLLLQHHAVLCDLSPMQRAMAEWIAFSRQHAALGLDNDVLYASLMRLDESWTDTILADDEEELLAEAFKMFVDFSLSLLRRQRDLFPPTHAPSLERLHAMLGCLAHIRSMDAFRRCCPFRKDVQAETRSVIKKGTVEWYDKMHALTRPQVNDDESTLRSFVQLINIVNDDLHRAIKFYEPLFTNALDLSYFVITYNQLDRLVTDDVGTAVQELCETFRQLDVVDKDMNEHHITMGTGLFELYLALQEFVSFNEHLPQGRDTSVLATAEYAKWFSDAVTRWLHIARYKAMLRISKSIEIEKTVTQVDSMVKHSTSAVDTTACFYQIKTFWKQLAWPDRVGSYVFVAKILDDICYGAVYFADLTYRKLCDAGFYDEEGQFDVTEQLCVTINNIEHVRESLQQLPIELGTEAVVCAVAMAKDEVSADTCRRAIDQVMHSALDDIHHQILRVVEHVGEKMRADVRKFAFHLSWAPDGLPADDAIVPLMEYLDTNLTTLNAGLLSINFERVLAALWAVAQEELRIQAESGVGEKRTVFYQRLHDGLQYLKDYFHAEGKGMQKERLENAQYQSFQRFLDLHRNDTEALIIHYYLERLEMQKHITENGPHDFGVLTVRVYFHHDSLSVEILSARDILALDTNGYSDPFVIIEILPQNVFTQCPTQRTRVQKKTLTPVFEEVFEYPATLQQCTTLGAMIQFTVMDHDMVLSNDFAGEAFLPLDQIPGVADNTPCIMHGLKPIDLPLLRPKRSENEILNALEKRPWDKKAQEFVKRQKAHSA